MLEAEEGSAAVRLGSSPLAGVPTQSCPENHLLLFQQEQDLLVLLLKLLCGHLEKGSGHLTGRRGGA